MATEFDPVSDPYDFERYDPEAHDSCAQEYDLDDELRRLLDDELPHPDEAYWALAGLQPALVSARRRSRMRRAMAGTVMFVMVGAAVTTALDRFSLTTDAVVVAGPAVGTGESGGVVDGSSTGPSSSELHLSLPTVGETAANGSAADGGLVVDGGSAALDSSTSAAPPVDDTASTGADTTAIATTSGDPATTAGSSSSAQTTATAVTTIPTTGASSGPGSSASASTTMVETRCGAVAVEQLGPDVTFHEALPNVGFHADIKDRGLDEVKVTFKGPGDDCEVKVEVEVDGDLEVEGEDH